MSVCSCSCSHSHLLARKSITHRSYTYHLSITLSNSIERRYESNCPVPAYLTWISQHARKWKGETLIASPWETRPNTSCVLAREHKMDAYSGLACVRTFQLRNCWLVAGGGGGEFNFGSCRSSITPTLHKYRIEPHKLTQIQIIVSRIGTT
jgi:hypothetical protein